LPFPVIPCLFYTPSSKSFLVRSLKPCENIVKFHGYTSRPCGLVLELCDLVLKDYLINDKNVITSVDAFQIAKDIASGIFHIHEQDIVHFDIKPSNVLLKSSPLRCLISDFGSARPIGSNIGMVKGISVPNYAAFTLPFCSPEVLYSLFYTYFCTLTRHVDS
jgi:serine/threonine protein kinase